MLDSLTLSAFRCVASAEIRPSIGFNIISGANAQGKTTLLEAIHLISTGRLLRGSRDVQAIQEGADASLVKASLSTSGTELAVSLARGARKRALLNGLPLPRASDLLGRLPTVSFSATDLEIVRGDPAARRDFLDEELSQLQPSYLRHLAGYKRALEQRNALLRQAREHWPGAAVFEAWEQPLTDHGNELRRLRRQWIKELAPEAAQAHARLGGGEGLAASYDDRDDALSLESLAGTRGDDIARGATSIGPHRDDLSLMVGGMEARSFGSQGQQRTAVIALKLAVQVLARRTFGFPPVLLLDDVFSDLDASRRSQLVAHAMQEGGQVFLSCTEPDQAGSELVSRSRVFRLVKGQVSES